MIANENLKLKNIFYTIFIQYSHKKADMFRKLAAMNCHFS